MVLIPGVPKTGPRPSVPHPEAVGSQQVASYICFSVTHLVADLSTGPTERDYLTVGSSSLQLPFASPSAPTRQAWLRSLKAKQGHTATLPRAVQLPPVALWPQSAPHVSDAWNFCVCRSGYRRTKLQQYHGSPHPRHRSGADNHLRSSRRTHASCGGHWRACIHEPSFQSYRTFRVVFNDKGFQ